MKRVLITLFAVGLLLGACSRGGDGATFQFHGTTTRGQLIPVSDRKPAGNFTSELLDGTKFDLADTRGKVVLLNYWASWCPPCQTEGPQFSVLYSQVKNKGVDFYGVDTDDTRDRAEGFITQNKISYPSVVDEEGRSELKLGNIPSTTLPHTILLDRQGRVAAVYIAQLTARDLEKPIDELAAGH